MPMVTQGGTPILLSDSGIVSKASCALIGFYVNSTSSGAIVIYDGTAATGTAVSGTITPAIGFHAFPCVLPNGCYIAKTAGSINLTGFVQAT
jgi:hypothetical protein